MSIEDRAAVVAGQIMQIVRGSFSKAFLRQKVSPIHAAIEALLREEFEQHAREAINNFRNDSPAT